MKTFKFFLVTLAVLLMSATAAMANFSQASLTLRVNGNEMTINPVAQPNVNIDDGVWSFVIDDFEATTTMSVSNVLLVYSFFQGNTQVTQEAAITGKHDGNGIKWEQDGDPQELISGLEVGKTYTLKYYLLGGDEADYFILPQNGYNKFSVTFTVAPASADFESFTITAITGNTQDSHTENIKLPASGMGLQDLSDEADNVFTLEQWEAKTTQAASFVDAYYRVYEENSTPGAFIKSAGTSTDMRTWRSTQAIDVLQGLTKDKKYILEFYVHGRNANGDIYYSNGGANYKVKFLYSDKTAGTGFYTGVDNPANITLLVNGKEQSYALPGCKQQYSNGAVQLGKVSTLNLSKFNIMVQREDTDIDINNVSMQQQVYLASETDNWNWNGIQATNSAIVSEDGLVMDFTCTDNVDLTEHFNMTYGNSYILEVMPQVITPDDKWHWLIDKEIQGSRIGFKFQFDYVSPTGIDTVADTPVTLHGKTYNLAGQRVSDSYKGIVIENGRKVIK